MAGLVNIATCEGEREALSVFHEVFMKGSQVCWHMSEIPGLGKLRHEDCYKFKVSLLHSERQVSMVYRAS